MVRLLRDLVAETPAKVVGQSSSAAAAIRDIGRTRPDVAIVDISLAEGNGFEVVKAMALTEPRPLVFVLTNHATRRYREHAARLGADAFYDKQNEIIALLRSLTSLATASPDPAAEKLAEPSGEQLPKP